MALKLLKLFLLSSILPLFLFFSVKPTFASSLNWQLVYSSVPESTAIRASKLKPGLIYASLRKPGWDFDLLKSTDYGVTWTSIKPGLPSGGDINWISVHPSDPKFVAISLWGAGFYASYDEGNTWVQLLGFSEPRLVETDPTHPYDRIYVGGTAGFGLHRLTKVGGVWQDQKILSGNTDGNTAQIIIDMNNPAHIFADAGTAFYRSWNSGDTWTLLSLDRADSAGGIAVDNTIYTGRSTYNEGVYKSTDDGVNWTWKNNNGLTGMIYNFSLYQKSGAIFVTRGHDQGGGLWETTNGGDNWENVSSSSWGTNNTWGTEVAGNYVYVSVQGLGIYRADLTPPSTPTPVVFLPGFGGSWSYKGLVENQSTGAGDWTLLPLADPYYQPFLATLKNAGLSDSGPAQNLFTFAYDYRKSITDTAAILNSYLDTVIAKNPGKKVNLVAHSMGSLVARQCFEKAPGCAGKINKIITAGGPHAGTIKAYQLWEGGEIDVSDVLTRAAADIAMHVTGWPYLSDKDIVQHNFPGVRDSLPPTLAGNPNLQALTPASAGFSSVVFPLAGNTASTKVSFTLATLSSLDKILGLWADGKPGSYTFAPGDDTVLQTSAEIAGNANNKDYSVHHGDYLRDNTVVADILSILGLPATPLASVPSAPTSFLSFVIHSPATITVKDSGGNLAGTNVDGKAVFITNPTSQNYQVTLTGTGNGNLQLDSFYTNGSGVSKKTYNGSTTPGATSTINYQNYNFNTTVESFRAKIAATNNRNLATIEALVVTSVNNITANRNRAAAFLNLETSSLNIWKLVLTENDGTNRQNLRECADQLQGLMVSLNTQYGTAPTNSSVTAEIARAQTAVNLKMTKTLTLPRDGANLDLAQKQLSSANLLFSSGSNYAAVLSARAATVLAN